MAKQITAIIPTLNCAYNLKNCLESITWVDQVIVVDMGSKDGTIELAKRYGCTIIRKKPKDGNFDLNRKYGMIKAAGQWLLKIDSDEVISGELRDEIILAMNSVNNVINGYELKNRIYFGGKQVKHGFVKSESNELRLVRNRTWQYNPYKFHEQIKVKGRVGRLSGYYDHYNHGGTSDFIAKMNKYTSLDAKILAKQLSINPLAMIFGMPATFIKLYVIQLGFLDKHVGFVTCYLYGLYNVVEKIKRWEQKDIIRAN